MDRRFFLGIVAALMPTPAFASILDYRGFRIDSMEVGNSTDVTAAIKRQIDIAADCGARADVIDFFKSQPIAVRRALPSPPGRFIPGKGVEVVGADLAPERPIILHELLHAFMFYRLPGGGNNPDVATFFARARAVYPATEIHGGRKTRTYLLTNPNEFFAVTGSLYLWGSVDREPHSRERLKELQPIYYDWLARTFGVQH